MHSAHKFSAPSKTFLLGEYYVTAPGEALLLMSSPDFHLSLSPGSFQLKNITNESPAGKFIHSHLDFFSNYEIEFIDPYQGRGGLGASTAAFLLVYQALHRSFSLDNLLDSYLSYAWNGKGAVPSAADLLAQWQASKNQSKKNLFYVNRLVRHVESLTWPFKNLSCHVIHTGKKIATHQHLLEIDRYARYESLAEIFSRGKKAIDAHDAELFCAAINDYRRTLDRMDLLSLHSKELICEFMKDKNVLAAKGCGALGADTILLITPSSYHELVQALCEKLNLFYVAHHE